MNQQAHEIAALHRNAAFRRCIPVSGTVHENRAAPAHRPRPQIIIEYDDDVVQPIVAPHTLGRCRIGMPDMPIVVAITSCIAPSVVGPQRDKRQPHTWPQNPISAVVRPHESEPPDRCRAITLALDRPLPRSSERTAYAQISKRQPALSCRCGPAQYTQLRLAVAGFLLNLTPRFHHDAPRQGQ